MLSIYDRMCYNIASAHNIGYHVTSYCTIPHSCLVGRRPVMTVAIEAILAWLPCVLMRVAKFAGESDKLAVLAHQWVSVAQKGVAKFAHARSIAGVCLSGTSICLHSASNFAALGTHEWGSFPLKKIIPGPSYSFFRVPAPRKPYIPYPNPRVE